MTFPFLSSPSLDRRYLLLILGTNTMSASRHTLHSSDTITQNYALFEPMRNSTAHTIQKQHLTKKQSSHLRPTQAQKYVFQATESTDAHSEYPRSTGYECIVVTYGLRLSTTLVRLRCRLYEYILLFFVASSNPLPFRLWKGGGHFHAGVLIGLDHTLSSDMLLTTDLSSNDCLLI